ncbi:MAG: glycosyltransferase family 2 protein [Cyanobium sp.]|jgi:glycosyltransferase involved in cell wall biosynthesis
MCNYLAPFFTIVVPAYNREVFISDCIDSVLSQTFENYELVIVDDASSDKTLSIALSYALRDSRVRVISNPQNLGPQRSRNIGLNLARGKYIVFLDSDDVLSPCYLQIAFKAFSDYVGIELFSVGCIRDIEAPSFNSINEAKFDELLSCRKVDIRTYLNQTYQWPTSAACWNRQALLDLGGWDETLTLWQDWELNARYLASGKNALLFETPLLFYRLSDDGLSRQNDRKIHIPYLRSRIAAWKACRASKVHVSLHDLWVTDFCGAVRICRREESDLWWLIIAIYYSLLCSPSLRSLRLVRSAWRAGTKDRYTRIGHKPII